MARKIVGVNWINLLILVVGVVVAVLVAPLVKGLLPENIQSRL